MVPLALPDGQAVAASLRSKATLVITVGGDEFNGHSARNVSHHGQ